VLCGITIAIGVIMAGPLLVFGFMVLPPLAARGLARGMGAYFALSSLLGLATAVFGFYLSVRLDLPLGPTDVALGCGVIFLIYVYQFMLRKIRGLTCLWIILILAVSGCSARAPQPTLDLQSVKQSPIWLASVKNSTGATLRLPGANPLRSLAEMAGKLGPEYRPTVMDLLRDSLKRELESRGSAVGFPEGQDIRLSLFPFDADDAARGARAAKLSGYLWLMEIRRWEGDPHGLLRTWVEFKLVHIDDGSIAWQQRVQKTVFSPGARADQSAADAVNEILREALGS
ncbi:MAG: metal ABC transporter permease, partial [Deltaproteobacteria bacterium]|nr:metal ABC transporter permease [Deltaproteobacteria bacterium]